ncbi:MAG: class I SAM-dependent methyltransferase [Candidatus Eiseniibacteriota bacterium]
MRELLARLFGRFRPADPVIGEWEWYARAHRKSAGGPPLGEEWNRPESIGVDVPPGELVAHLDRTLVSPLLGHVGTLLEIGAGGGRFTAQLVEHADRLIAADTAPTMVALLGERFRGEPKVEPLLLDGTTLRPLVDHSVDAAFSYDVFVHLTPWTIYLYLEELARVLVPGGRALLHHGNTFTDLGWNRFLYDVEGRRRGGGPDARFTLMTPAVMRELAEHAGLAVDRQVTDVVRRDCVTLLRAPERESGASTPPASGS